jgi:PPM family protein phosphatase
MSNTITKTQRDLCQRVLIAVKSDRGVRHETNEDAFSIIRTDNYQLFAVADGMGGPSKGEIASHLALSSIETFLKGKKNLTKEDLTTAIQKANKALVELINSGPNFKGIGTTLTALAIVEDRIFFAHVGNSRIYHLAKGELKQITTDHTLANEKLTESEVKDSDKMLTRFLGVESELEIELKEYQTDNAGGDYFIICSDGLFSALSEEQIQKVVVSLEPKAAVAQLVQLANEGSGSDNVTVVVAQIESEEPQPELESREHKPSPQIEFPSSLVSGSGSRTQLVKGSGAAQGITGVTIGASLFGASSEFLGNPGLSSAPDLAAQVEETPTTSEVLSSSVEEEPAKDDESLSEDPSVSNKTDEGDDESIKVHADESGQAASAHASEDEDKSQKKKRKRKRKRKKRTDLDSEGQESREGRTEHDATQEFSPSDGVQQQEESDSAPEYEEDDHAGFDSPEEFDDLSYDDDDDEYDDEVESSEEEEYSYLRPPAYQQKRSSVMRRVVIAMFIGFGCGALLAVVSRGGKKLDLASVDSTSQQSVESQRDNPSLEDLLRGPEIADNNTEGEQSSDEKVYEPVRVAKVNPSESSIRRSKNDPEPKKQLAMKNLIPVERVALPPITTFPPPNSEGRIFSDDIMARVDKISSPAMKMMAIEVYGAIRQTVRDTDDKMIRMAERQIDTFALLEQVSVEIEKLEREEETRTGSIHINTDTEFVEFSS